MSSAEMGRGRFRAARAHIDSAAQLGHASAVEALTALMALESFVPTSDAELTRLRAALSGPPGAADTRSASGLLATLVAVEAPVRSALLSRLSLRLGDTAAARRQLSEMETAPVQPGYEALRDLFVHTSRARLALADKQPARAVNEVMQLRDRGPEFVGKPTMPLTSSVRFARAEVFAAAGRPADALKWYGAFEHTSPFGHAYVAAAELRRAELLYATGDRTGAAPHYAKVVALWKDADPELQPVVAVARRRMQ
jgi:ATP/maltotriose-dependent transcriptional regulator MalT